MQTHEPYTHTAKVLHWTTAGLIVLQYVLAELAEAAAERDSAITQLALLANHKSVGITVLGLAILRLGWRFTHRPKAPPQPHTKVQRAASAMHWALYVLIFAMPLSGWLMSSASAYSVSWFGMIQLPDLVTANETTKALLQTVHESLAILLLILALGHLLAAFKHHWLDRDSVLSDMSSWPSLGLFVGVIGIGLWQLALLSSPAANAQSHERARSSTGGAPSLVVPAAAPSDLPLWDIDYAQSSIRFTGNQAGASFTGSFDTWQAAIQFDPAALPASTATVQIDLASVNTQDSERDDTARSPDWFAAAEFPKARYHADEFEAHPDGSITALGTLELKGTTAAVPLLLRLVPEQDRMRLTGSATLDRLSLGLGSGDWADPEWVGHQFEIQVDVITKAAP